MHYPLLLQILLRKSHILAKISLSLIHLHYFIADVMIKHPLLNVMHMIYLDICPYIELLHLTIYWYGILYSLSAMSVWLLCQHVVRKLIGAQSNNIHAPSAKLFDAFMFGSVVAMIVGARLGHVVFFEWSYYKNHLDEILMLRNGGLSFHGGLFAMILHTVWFCRKTNIKWLLLADIVCYAAPIGLSIGRFANFINQELIGKATDFKYAVVFTFVDTLPRHPTQLYESAGEGLLNFVVMSLLLRLRGLQSIGTGVFAACFCVVYAWARFVIEFFKDAEVCPWWTSSQLTTGQVLCLFMLTFGILLFPRKKRYI